MSSISVVVSSARPSQSLIVNKYRPWLSALLIWFLDVSGLALSFGVAMITWSKIRSQVVTLSNLDCLIALCLFVGIFKVTELYRTIGIGPVEELRRVVLAISWTFLLLTLITFLLKEGTTYSRGLIMFAWCCATTLIPVTRLTVKPIFGKRSWFAKPVAIFGSGKKASEVIETLRRNPGLALRPVVVFSDNPPECDQLVNVPVMGGLDGAAAYCRSVGIDYAIIAMPELSRERWLEVIRSVRGSFSEVLLLPDLLGVSSLWVETRDVGGTLGLEVRDNLLQRSALAAKRLLDLALIIISAPLVAPLCGVIALVVKLHSRGPVFYSQERVGRLGHMIRVRKFRTMHEDAEELLQRFLTENPELKTEWLKDHKLKNDPRITLLGRFLRKTSLDELPQLWNVVKGEMSLVGPRPIVFAEILKFGDSFQMYTRVSPGITGPWQVSGRNRLSYEERVSLNEHYVRNWSVWLDLFILFKTVRAVLTFDGAY